MHMCSLYFPQTIQIVLLALDNNCDIFKSEGSPMGNTDLVLTIKPQGFTIYYTIYNYYLFIWKSNTHLCILSFKNHQIKA